MKKERKILIGLVAALIIVLGMSSILGYSLYKTHNQLKEANTVIASKIDEVQEFDRKLGISESNLRRSEDLREEYEKEIEEFQNELQEKTDKIRAKDLSIHSRDETIAALKQTIKGGESSVSTVEVREDPKTGKEVKFETIVDVKEVCNDKTLAYSWQDEHQRFHLQDPDISISGNETFKSRQFIKITGLVLQDDSGNVQVKKITAKEVVPQKQDDDVVYMPTDGGDLVLIDSKFEYINKEENEGSLLDVFTLRPIATFDTAITPGLGLEIINLGRLIDYANVGLYGKVAFDVSDPLGGSLQNSRLGVGAAYHIVPPLLNTNFAIGASISTPFNNLGQIIFTVDLILYLTDDLSPFKLLY